MTATSPLEAGGHTPREIDEFIFRWFNERQPEEMQRCLEGHDALCDQAAAVQP